MKPLTVVFSRMNVPMSSPSSAPVAIVGAGALGTTIAPALVANGYAVEAVLSRTAASAEALADQVGAPVADTAYAALPDAVRWVFVCVSDDAIAEAAASLAAVRHPWADTTVAHTSGAVPAQALAPLGARGAALLGFHPLQTFPEKASPAAFADIVVGLDGDSAAVEAGAAMARHLGARPVRLAAADKARYHAAAALASNGLVALMAAVEAVLPTARTDAAPPPREWVAPLLRQTLHNVLHCGPDGALSGPVARGDEGTIRKHLEVLQDECPDQHPLYTALSAELVRVAVRSGSISEAQGERLAASFRPADDAPKAST